MAAWLIKNKIKIYIIRRKKNHLCFIIESDYVPLKVNLIEHTYFHVKMHWVSKAQLLKKHKIGAMIK